MGVGRVPKRQIGHKLLDLAREVMAAEPSPAGRPVILWTDRDFADAQFVIDCRPSKASAGALKLPTLTWGDPEGRRIELPLTGAKLGKVARFLITVQGPEVTVSLDGKEVGRVSLPKEMPARGRLGLSVTGERAQFMNIYVRAL
jgi:hypothetical protein